MADDLKIQIGIELENPQSLMKKVQNDLNKFKGLNLDIGFNEGMLNNLTSSVAKLSKYKVKIVDDNQITETKTINKNLAETQKIIQTLDKNNNLKETVETTTDLAKVQKQIYSELSKLQNEEYAIKKKMLGANQEQTGMLEKQLGIVTEQQKQMVRLSNEYGVNDQIKNQELMVSNQKKLNELKLEEQKINEKNNKADSNELYKTRAKLLKDEYSIKEKLLNAEGEYSQELENQLNTIKKRQSELKIKTDSNKVNDIQKENKLLEEQHSLEMKLSQSNSKKSEKHQQELRAMDQLIQKNKELINIKEKDMIDKYGSNNVNTQRIEELRKQLLNLNRTSMSELKGEINSINGELNKVEKEAKEVGHELRSIDGSNIFGDTSKFLATVGFYYGIDDVIRGIVSNVRNMDDALVDLTKVVDLTDSQMNDMTNSALEMGKALGQSASDIMNGMAEFGRVTKNLEEIKTLTETAIMGANVTDLNVEGMSKALNTTLLSMGLSASESMRVLDTWNELQNNFRISGEDLAEGIGVAGNVAKQTGVELEQLEGYLTAIVSTTGIAGSEAGTALKSMMSRLYRIGTEGAEDAGKCEKALQGIGIAVRDGDESFRDFDDILAEVAVKFQDLSEAEQMMVAQEIAGTHHYSKFIGLVENMNLANEATEKAMNSSGSAIKENEKYLNSITGKVETMKVSFESLSMSVLDSDMFKGFIDGATKGINAIEKVVDTFGILPVTISGVSAVMSVMNSKFRDRSIALFPSTLGKVNNMFGKQINIIQDNIDGNNKLINTYKKTGQSTVALEKSTAKLQVKQAALRASSSLLQGVLTGGLALAFSVVAGAIFKCIDNIVNADEKLKEFNENLSSSVAESTEKVKDSEENIKSAKEAMAEIKELESKLNEESNEETRLQLEDEILGKKEEMLRLFPDLKQGYDNEADAMANLEDALQGYIDKQNELIKIEQRKQGNDAFEYFQKDENRGLTEELDGITNAKKELAELEALEKRLGKLNPNDVIQKEIFDEYGRSAGFAKVTVEDALTHIGNAINDNNNVLEEGSGQIEQFKQMYSALEESGRYIPPELKKTYDAIKQLEEGNYEATESFEFLQNKLLKEIDLAEIIPDPTKLKEFGDDMRDILANDWELDSGIEKSIDNMITQMEEGALSVKEFDGIVKRVFSNSKLEFGDMDNAASRFTEGLVSSMEQNKISTEDFEKAMQTMEFYSTESFNNMHNNGKNALAGLLEQFNLNEISLEEFTNAANLMSTFTSEYMNSLDNNTRNAFNSIIGKFNEGELNANEFTLGMNTMQMLTSDEVAKLDQNTRTALGNLREQFISGEITAQEFSSGVVEAMLNSEDKVSGFSGTTKRNIGDVIQAFLEGKISAQELKTAIDNLKDKKVVVTYEERRNVITTNRVTSNGEVVEGIIQSLPESPNNSNIQSRANLTHENVVDVEEKVTYNTSNTPETYSSNLQRNRLTRGKDYSFSDYDSRAYKDKEQSEEDLQRKREQLERDANSAIEKSRNELYKALKNKIEKQKADELSLYDAKISKIREEIELLQDDTEEKNKNLDKMKEELALWEKQAATDNYAKIQADKLKEQIAQIEKELKIEDLQNQIADIEKEKEEVEKNYEIKLSDEFLYNEANQMVLEGNMAKMTELIKNYSPDFSDIGLLFGKTLADGIKEGLQQGLDGLDYLKKNGKSVGSRSFATFGLSDINVRSTAPFSVEGLSIPNIGSFGTNFRGLTNNNNNSISVINHIKVEATKDTNIPKTIREVGSNISKAIFDEARKNGYNRTLTK